MIKQTIPILFISLHFIFAEIIYVPDDYQDIQSAINASEDGDSVIVEPGFYPGAINFVGKEIVVSSLYILENDSLIIGSTIIDAQSNSSVVTFSNGETLQSVLQGFTLQGGIGNDEDPDDNGSFYNYGGGIYCVDSDPTVKDCIIQNNIANEGGGGGIFCYNASPTFSGCLISGNESDDVGGGLYSRQNSSPSFYNCTFYDNTAEFGGGCYLRNESNPIFESVTFSSNTANNSGGGIGLKDDADLQGQNIYITNNIAEGLGGGLYINNANPQFSSTLISDNISSSGAGIYVRNNSTVDFNNLTIANNSAGLYGNGVYMRDAAELNVLNTIIWGNGSTQVYFRSEGTGVELNISYSLVENGEDGIQINDNGDLNWGSGNLDEEPYFCSSGIGNYYIRENSPCVDGGFNGELIGCFESGCGPINVGPIWYVDNNGDNDSDGSINTPFETISRAITSAEDGDTIRLNPGVYIEPVDFDNKEVVLESRAFELDNPGIISETFFGPGTIGGTCMILDGPTNNGATIRGVSLRGGSDPFGGGLVITNSSPTLENMIIEDNTSEIGGGIYLSDSDAILRDITIRNNGANLGGGIYITDGSPYLENILFDNNVAYWGGGLYVENASPNLEGCILKNNNAFIEGAGLYQSGGISNINWTSFENNNGYDYGGGIVANQATINLNQSTFAGNIAGVGSAMSLHSAAIVITNSILWGNDGDLFYLPEEGGLTSLEINFSDIEGGQDLINTYSNLLFNTEGGIINYNPEFCNPSDGQFKLGENSICRSASESSGVIGAYLSNCGELNIMADPIVNDFKFLDNYPNPFNPITTITYFLLDDGNFSLKVYDLNGRKIRTLLSEFGYPGEGTITWDARNDFGEKVSSGIYIYQLVTDKKIRSKKMMLLK